MESPLSRRGLVCVLAVLLSASWLCMCMAETQSVKVSVQSVTSTASTDKNFICATLDWWPEDKCDYGQCPWGKAGLLNLDLKNKILGNALKAFDSMRIRIGGSLQDQVIYQIGDVKECPQFEKKNGSLFGFTKGCLPMNRWDELNELFNKTGALVTFSLNALHGRQKSGLDEILYQGEWDGQNAADFMKYTAQKGYKIDSYELGNELCGEGVSARVEAEPYAKDVIALKKLVEELYPDSKSRPKILGPAGFYNKTWFDKFLHASGPSVVHGLTHHIYNLGAGRDPDLINKVQDPYFLDIIAQTYRDIETSIKAYGPWAGAWVGEAGGAYNSGGKDVSHTFADGFWYLDQLGMTSTFNHKVYCRQALIGGNYGLLNTTTFIPNPDYYGALLWHRLMGKTVLTTTHNGSPYLRTYTHCSKKTNGVTMMLINMSNSTSYDISVENDLNFYMARRSRASVITGKEVDSSQMREEYHLTPQDGNIQSDVLLLNGQPLKLTESSDIPELKPKLVDPSTPIRVERDSIVFVTIKNFKAPACSMSLP